MRHSARSILSPITVYLQAEPLKKFEAFLAHCQKMAGRVKVPGLPGQISPSKRRAFVDQISSTFLDGYDAALHTDLERLTGQLESLSFTEKAVATEGAYTALATIDLSKQNNLEQVNRFSQSSDIKDATRFLGIGYALSHLNIDPSVSEQHMSEFWGWQTMEAYGFHEGYFKWPLTIEKLTLPANISGLAARAFDQGVGRAIWILCVAEPSLISQMIDRFPPQRRHDLWSGVGMMTGFWGLVDERDLKILLRKSKKDYAALQQGVAFSTWIRHENKEPKDFTDGACRLICKTESHNMGAQVQGIMAELLASGAIPNGVMFAQWKDTVAQIFTKPS